MASVSFKIQILPQKQKKDKTFPVTIRIGWKSKYSYIFTDFSAKKEDLTKDLNLKNTRILDKCNVLIKQYREIVDNIEDISMLSAIDVTKFIQHKLTHKNGLDFMQFTKELVLKMKQENNPSFPTYNPMLNHLMEFHGDTPLMVNKITPGFLQEFHNYLKAQGVGENGQLSYLSRLRATYNRCIDEYEHLGYTFAYPFRRFKMPTVKPRQSSVLSKGQILKVLNHDPKTKRGQIAKQAFSLTLFTLGTNAKDLYGLKHSKNNRIEYERAKTKEKRTDNAFISIGIQPELKPYLNKYKGKEGYMFSFRDTYKDSKDFNKAISFGLRAISKELQIDEFEYYDVRRTIASVMRNKLGISKDDIAMCLNHVDMSHKTTDYYIEIDFSIIDRCNRNFLDWLFESNC